MSGTIRTSRQCPVGALAPGLAAALASRLSADAVACCETRSVGGKKGMFGKKENVSLGAAAFTHEHFAWAAGPEEGPFESGVALLRDIEVEDYETSPLARLQADTGITVNGLSSPVPGERGSTFVGLGSDAAGQQFRAALRDAIRVARGV